MSPITAVQTASQGHWLQGVAGRYGRQLPFTQISPTPQTLPQPPQLSGSTLKSVQLIRLLLLHASAGQSPWVHCRCCGGCCSVMQVLHVPELHIWPLAHGVLQPPQLLAFT